MAFTVLDVLPPGGDRQAPLEGLVSQMVNVTFRDTGVSGDAVMVAVLPTFTVDTEKAFEPLVPGKSTMPSPVGVAANVTISATGPLEAESSNVLTPGITVAD